MLTIKGKLTQPEVKYQIYFSAYLGFLSILSYFVLYVKPCLLERNNEITFFTINSTHAQNKMIRYVQ